MRKRLPIFIFAIGLLGASLYPRLSTKLPPGMRSDFATGAVMGAFIGVELVGVMMMIRRPRCRVT
jgi:hypothetical protein